MENNPVSCILKLIVHQPYQLYYKAYYLFVVLGSVLGWVLVANFPVFETVGDLTIAAVNAVLFSDYFVLCKNSHTKSQLQQKGHKVTKEVIAFSFPSFTPFSIYIHYPHLIHYPY